MITRMTHERWKHVLSTDELHAALCGVYYEPDKKRLTGTNGHILLSIEVDEVEEGDVECILPLSAFDGRGVRASTRQMLKISFEQKGDRVQITTEAHRPPPKRGYSRLPETLSRRLTQSIEATYPNYQALIDRAEARIKTSEAGPVEIGLDLMFLDALHRALPFKKQGLRIHVGDDPHKATMMRWAPLPGGDEPLDYVILIMPIMLDPYDL